jgi:hypothetical protein
MHVSPTPPGTVLAPPRAVPHRAAAIYTTDWMPTTHISWLPNDQLPYLLAVRLLIGSQPASQPSFASNLAPPLPASLPKSIYLARRLVIIPGPAVSILLASLGVLILARSLARRVKLISGHCS